MTQKDAIDELVKDTGALFSAVAVLSDRVKELAARVDNLEAQTKVALY